MQMDIRGFGEANVRKFYEQGWLADIPGIYKLDFNKIALLEGFGKNQLIIWGRHREQKQQPLHRPIFGWNTAWRNNCKSAGSKNKSSLNWKNLQLEQLQTLDDIGPIVAGSIYHFFIMKSNIWCLKN